MRAKARNRWCLSLVFLAALAILLSCGGGRERFAMPAGEAHQALSEIDSLMWRQPDSAFVRLLEFAESPVADSLDAFDQHYCQLLISELLYKNDYEQSNRMALIQAVDYLDSFYEKHGGDKRTKTTDNLVFLDARSHYIKGVGYYERDSVVEACKEYLRALEVMEGYFEDKNLTGNLASFMTYNYNRLTELFSAQLLMESVIVCCERALVYCKRNPTSPQSVSKLLSRLGQQYDQMGKKEKAREYYSEAMNAMASHDGLGYRDLASIKALNEYQLGFESDQSLATLKQLLTLAESQTERLARFLTIGSIYYEEQRYDSALSYLNPVFEGVDVVAVQLQVAEYLRNIHQINGDSEKANGYAMFLADHTIKAYNDKVEASCLESMFDRFLTQEQENASRKAQKRIRLITVLVIVPMVLIITVVGLWTKQKSKKRRKIMEQQKKEAENRNEVLQHNLRHRDEEVQALRLAIERRHNASEQRRMAFLSEPVCRHVIQLVKSGPHTSRDDYYEHGISLDDGYLDQLKGAVSKYYGDFDTALLGRCSSLSRQDMTLCRLHLLGLNEREIAALTNRTYSGVKKQNESVMRKLGIEGKLSEFVMQLAETCAVSQGVPKGVLQDVPQDVPQDVSQFILEIVSQNPNITREEMAKQLGVSTKTVGRYIKKLGDSICFVGSGYSGHWEVRDHS